MAAVAAISVEERSAPARMAPPSRFGDKAFEWLTLGMALVVILLVFLIGWQLARGSSLAIQKVRIPFSGNIDLGSGCRTIRCLALHLRHAGVFTYRAHYCCAPEYCDRGLFDRARAALDSAASGFAD